MNTSYEYSEKCCFESHKFCATIARITGIEQNHSISKSVFILTWRIFFLLTAALYMSTLVSFTSAWLAIPDPNYRPPSSCVSIPNAHFEPSCSNISKRVATNPDVLPPYFSISSLADTDIPFGFGDGSTK